MGGAAREGRNIWWYLFSFSRYAKPSKIFRRYFWNRYVWHDSFGKFLWRLWCPVFGHLKKRVKNIEDNMAADRPTYHCFACERRVSDG